MPRITSMPPNEASSPSDRLKFLLKEIGINEDEFARTLGAEVDEIKEGDLNITQLGVVRNEYNVNPSWMTTGKGRPFLKTVKLPDLMDQIKDVFKRVRLDNRLSQEEMSQILGVKRTTLSNIEAGRQGASLHAIRVLKHKFGVSYDEIIDGQKNKAVIEKDNSQQEKINQLEKRIATLMKVIDKLSD